MLRMEKKTRYTEENFKWIGPTNCIIQRDKTKATTTDTSVGIRVMDTCYSLATIFVTYFAGSSYLGITDDCCYDLRKGARLDSKRPSQVYKSQML